MLICSCPGCSTASPLIVACSTEQWRTNCFRRWFSGKLSPYPSQSDATQALETDSVNPDMLNSTVKAIVHAHLNDLYVYGNVDIKGIEMAVTQRFLSGETESTAEAELRQFIQPIEKWTRQYRLMAGQVKLSNEVGQRLACASRHKTYPETATRNHGEGAQVWSVYPGPPQALTIMQNGCHRERHCLAVIRAQGKDRWCA